MINTIFPPTCGICGKIDENYLCKKCETKITNQACFLVECNIEEISELMYIFKYEGEIRNLILQYKFKEKAYLYKTLVKFLLKNEKIYKKTKNYDIIIPVPISKKRYKERGYNQSLLIAKEISKNLKIGIKKDILIKTKNIIEQSKLNKEEREKNIEKVYEVRKTKELENKKILIIDDIYTTGNTVKECARTLKKLNPKNIGVLTIAKD